MESAQTIVCNKLRLNPLAAFLAFPLTFGGVACSSAVAAATLHVTNCNDSGSGSLRAALAAAHNSDSIDLSALSCGTISIGTGELVVAVDNLTLQGPGAVALTIAGSQVVGHRYSVLRHSGNGTLRLDALKVTDNNAGFTNQVTSCIASTGTVYLNRSIVTECSTGAVVAKSFSARDSTISYSYRGVQTTGGNVAIVGSTISGNASYAQCVALHLGSRNVTPTGTATITNSTISGNSSFMYYYYGSNHVGCIYQPATIRNSTIAFNSARGLYIGTSGATIESSILARNSLADLSMPAAAQINGHANVIMNASGTVPADTIVADPLLLPLADNGGATQTHALAAGSPAIDAGNNLTALANDQRGASFVRVFGAGPDIGAFEVQPVAFGPGFTGSWFDPAQSGHGLMLEVLSNNRVLAMWFAFNPEGTQQSWFGGVGTYSGTTATITDVALPTGGRWIPNFDPNAIVRNPWGTLTLTFTDCTHGKIDFNSVRGYGSGSMKLLRLTQPAGLTCP